MVELADVRTRAEAGNGRPVADMTGLKGNYDIVLDIPIPQPELLSAPRGDANGAGAGRSRLGSRERASTCDP